MTDELALDLARGAIKFLEDLKNGSNDYYEDAFENLTIVSAAYLELKAAHDKLLEETLLIRVMVQEAKEEAAPRIPELRCEKCDSPKMLLPATTYPPHDNETHYAKCRNCGNEQEI